MFITELDILRLAPGMPEELAVLVAAFANSHRGFEDPGRADGVCNHASGAFLRLLRRTGYREEAQKVFWEFGQYRSGDESYEIGSGPAVPEWVRDSFLRGSTALKTWEAHTAICVGEHWYIDFTARQFDRDSEWPLIWEALECSPYLQAI